jgi:TusE/DsrC/DsvC family sulfur relay protein
MQTMQNGPQAPERDDEGFLLDPGDWNPGLMHAFAAEDGLELTPEHQQVIEFVRDYFEQRQVVPEARTVLKHMKSHFGEVRATRRYLYRLFPRGYGQQACKLAGMRKPLKLMLDV